MDLTQALLKVALSPMGPELPNKNQSMVSSNIGARTPVIVPPREAENSTLKALNLTANPSQQKMTEQPPARKSNNPGAWLTAGKKTQK